jgi:RNA 2',3'-cyclic 3'-phosphodiesterase
VSRLFVALWPPAEVLDQIEALPRQDRPGVRWTTRDQWHVTLRFLGSADVEVVEPALRALRHPPVQAVIGGRVGRLGTSALVVPVAGVDSLAAAVLEATVSAVPVPAGRDERFVGHLTLAWLKGTRVDGLVDCLIDATWSADEVALVESVLGSGPATYRTVATVALG